MKDTLKLGWMALTILLASSHSLPSAAAVGDLTVTPTRLILNDRDRNAQISLINRGADPATYRIDFVQYRMDDHGQLVEIDAPNEYEKFADELLRFSPRQITLQPNEAQTVRLLVRKPKDLPDGEYRSHLLFYALPPESVGNDIERRAPAPDEGFSIAITPVFRISIPVIIRHGELSAEFSINEVSLKQSEQPDSPLLLGLRVDRVGNRSVYGDLDVFYQDTETSEPILLAHYRDFVLYTSNNSRYTDLELHIPEGVDLSHGLLRVEYVASEDDYQEQLASYILPLR